jgi:small subunit ribosomal protein S3
LGQKVHPIGFRLGVSKDWQAKWYADKAYTDLIQEDLRIRQAISDKYGSDDISRVEIERSANQVTVTVYTARPGIVIGRGGQRVDEMRQSLEKTAGKRVRLNILEVAQPELDAYLVARSIAQQMERRISHRRAMKQAISRAIERGAQGIKITCAGRLSGSEYARKETLHQGRVPLHTLRADIDYAQAEAHTTLGRTGVKVWIYKGDVISESEKQFLEGSLLTPVEEREKVEEVASAEAEAVAGEAAMPVKSGGDEETEMPEPVGIADTEAVEDEQKAAEVKAEEVAKVETEAAEKPKAKAKAEVKEEAEAAERPKAKAKAEVKEEAEAAEKPKAEAKAKVKEEAEAAEKPKAKAKAKVKEEAEEPEAGQKAE